MSSVKNYNYEYFCGANVSIVFGKDSEQLDVAGISYQIQDSSTPIYGYASRVFDAVAPGQKIVRGTFVVNFTEFNAVAKSIATGWLKTKTTPLEKFDISSGQAIPGSPDPNANISDGTAYSLAFDYHVKEITRDFIDKGTGKLLPDKENDFTNYVNRVMYSETYDKYDALSLGANLLETFSLQQNPKKDIRSTQPKMRASSVNALVSHPFNIKIIFGDPGQMESEYSPNYIEILSCFINQIGGTIQINEDVLLQEFSFFARDIISN